VNNVETEEKNCDDFVEKIFHFKEIDSTNTFAKELGIFPVKGCFVIWADRQSAGRGRRDNLFFSGEGGIYASIVCNVPDVSVHFFYNRALSLAICDAVEELVPDAGLYIKWPNDIFRKNRKLCGILLESANNSSRHLVAGFGLNVNIPAEKFPEEIKNIATSILEQAGIVFDNKALLMNICRLFEKNIFEDPVVSHERYVRRLYRAGDTIRINNIVGIMETVLIDGQLCINTGKEKLLLSSGSIEFIT
jgi:BirA family transcriptional regulator, biotin operon repressor / biotin---[acetyl-CoA-carboxylase] ligase